MTGTCRARLRTVAGLLLRDGHRGVRGRICIPGIQDFWKDVPRVWGGPAANAQPGGRGSSVSPAGRARLGIEARQGRDPACRGSVRSTRARARKGIAPPKWDRRSRPGVTDRAVRRSRSGRAPAHRIANVRAPLHALEFAPELRRAPDRPDAPAPLLRRSSVVPVELGDRLCRAAEIDHLATPRHLDRRRGGPVGHQRPEVRPTFGGHLFEHSTLGRGATQGPTGFGLVALA